MEAIIFLVFLYLVCKGISALSRAIKERARRKKVERMIATQNRQRAEQIRQREIWKAQQAAERERVLQRIKQEKQRRLQQEETERQLRWADVERDFSALDNMDGHDFEHWCADLLKYSGFTKIQVTPGSGDQGVDIIAWKDNEKYAIQCKRYSKTLGNKPIQEVNTGRTIYGCSRAAVITNQGFTQGAINAAAAVGVLLWGRDKLAEMIRRKNAALGRSNPGREMSFGKSLSSALPAGGWKCPNCSMINSGNFCNECGTKKPVGIPAILAQSKPPEPSSSDSASINIGGYEAPNAQRQPMSLKDITWFKQALKEAKGYLESGSFSKKGLIEQLMYDGYSFEQAQYAADHCCANWLDQAKKEVQSYLSSRWYSRRGLIEQLEYDGYTNEEARVAVDSCGVMWKYQAYREAKSYLSSNSFSKSGLIEQLESDGFSHDEAEYAVERI